MMRLAARGAISHRRRKSVLDRPVRVFSRGVVPPLVPVSRSLSSFPSLHRPSPVLNLSCVRHPPASSKRTQQADLALLPSPPSRSPLRSLSGFFPSRVRRPASGLSPPSPGWQTQRRGLTGRAVVVQPRVARPFFPRSKCVRGRAPRPPAAAASHPPAHGAATSLVAAHPRLPEDHSAG